MWGLTAAKEASNSAEISDRYSARTASGRSVTGTSGGRQRITFGCAKAAEFTNMTTMIEARCTSRLRIGSANLADEFAAGIRKYANISWAFLKVCVSQLGSIFSRADRCSCPHGTPAGASSG